MIKIEPKSIKVDWDKISKLNISQYYDNIEKVDEEIETLIKVYIAPNEAPEHVTKLFQLTQLALEVVNYDYIEKDKDFNVLMKQRADLQKRFEEIREGYQKKEDELNSAKTELAFAKQNYETKLQELTKDILVKEEAMETMRLKKEQDIKNLTQTKDKEIDRLKKENERLQIELQSKEKMITRMNNNVDAISRTVKDKESDKQRLMDDIDMLEENNKKLLNTVNQLTSKAEAYKQEISNSSLQNELEDKIMAQREFDEQLDRMKREKRMEEEKLARKEEFISELQREHEQEKIQLQNVFKFEISAKLDEIETLKEDKIDLRKQVEELKRDLEASNQEISASKLKTEDVITSLEERNKLLTEEIGKIKKNKSQLSDVQIQPSSSSSTNPELEGYIVKLRESDATIHQLKGTVAMLQNDRNQLIKDYSIRDKELVDLRAKLAQYDSGVDGMMEARKEITYLKEQIAEREKVIADLKLELNKYLNNLANLSDAIAIFERKHNMKISKDDISQYRVQREKELESLVARLQQQNTKDSHQFDLVKNDLQNEVNRVTKEVGIWKEKCDGLAREVKLLKMKAEEKGILDGLSDSEVAKISEIIEKYRRGEDILLDIESVEKRLKIEKNLNDELKQKIQILQQTISEATTTPDQAGTSDHFKMVTEMNVKITSQLNKLMAQQEEIEQLKSELYKLDSENEQLNRCVEEKEAKIEELSALLLLKDQDTLKMSRELSAKLEEIEYKERKIQELYEKSSSLDSIDLYQIINRQKVEIEEYHEKVSSQFTQIQKMQLTLDRFSKKVNELVSAKDKRDIECEKLFKELSKIRQSLFSEKMENEKLAYDLTFTLQQLSDKERLVLKMNSHIVELEKALEQFKSQVEKNGRLEEEAIKRKVLLYQANDSMKDKQMIEDLTMELRKIQYQLDSCQQRSSDKDKETTILKEKLIQIKKEFSKQIECLKNEKEVLEDENKHKNTIIQSLKHAYEAKCKLIDQRSELVDRLQISIADLKEKLFTEMQIVKELSEKLSKRTNETTADVITKFRDVMSIIDSSKENPILQVAGIPIHEFDAILKEKNEEINKMKEEKSTLEVEYKKTTEMLLTYKQQIEELKTEVEEKESILVATITELQNQLTNEKTVSERLRQEMVNPALSRMIKQYEQDLEKAAGQKQKLEKTIQNMSTDLDKMNKAMKERDDRKRQLSVRGSVVAIKTAGSLVAEEYQKSLSQKVEHLENVLQEKEEQLLRSEKRVKQIIDEQSAYTNQITALEKELELKQQLLDKQANSIRLQKKKEKTLISELDKYKQGDYSAEARAYEKVEELQKRIHVLTMNNNGQMLRKENERLLKDKLESEIKRNELKKALEELEIEFESEKSNFIKEKEKTRVEFTKAENVIKKQYEAMLEEKESRIISIKKEIDELKNEIGKWKKRNSDISEEKERVTKMLQADITRYQLENKDLSEKLKDWQQRYNQTIDKMKAMQTSEDEFKRRVSKEVSEYSKVKDVEKRLREQIEMYQKQIEEKNSKIQQLSKTVDDGKSFAEQIERQKQDVMTQLANLKKDQVKSKHEFPEYDLRKRIQELEKKNNLLEDEKTSLQKFIEVKHKQEILELKQEIKRLMENAIDKKHLQPDTALNETLTKIELLEDKVLQAEKENLELKFDCEKLTMQIGRLQHRLKSSESFQMIQDEVVNTLKSGKKEKKTEKVKKVEEYEQVIESMNKVITKLQLEIETVRKNQISTTKFMDIKKENRNLKEKISDLEKQITDYKRRC